MVKFPNECLTKMYTSTRQLEVALGPDTNEFVLLVLVGLHSGSVVAGALHDEKNLFSMIWWYGKCCFLPSMLLFQFMYFSFHYLSTPHPCFQKSSYQLNFHFLQMNTASRVESTGIPDRLQMPQETADLLMLTGKPHWCIPRKDKVTAKGKCDLQAYFLKHIGPNFIVPKETKSWCFPGGVNMLPPIDGPAGIDIRQIKGT